MAVDDDEHVVGFIALVDQRVVFGKVLESGGRANLGLLDTGQGVGEQCGMPDQILDEQLLARFAGIDVLEHVAACVGDQCQRLVAGIAAARQVDALAQPDQIAFLQVEQRTLVDQCVQQAVIDDEQLVAGQVARQVFACLLYTSPSPRD